LAGHLKIIGRNSRPAKQAMCRSPGENFAYFFRPAPEKLLRMRSMMEDVERPAR